MTTLRQRLTRALDARALGGIELGPHRQPASFAEDLVIARQEISHEGPHSSRIGLPVWTS